MWASAYVRWQYSTSAKLRRLDQHRFVPITIGRFFVCTNISPWLDDIVPVANYLSQTCPEIHNVKRLPPMR
jgi:hypothetical protein